VTEGVPSGYRELLIAHAGLQSPRQLHDPDGNPITLVPPGQRGIHGIGIRLGVSDTARQRLFYTKAMGLIEEQPGAFRSGDSLLLVEQDTSARPTGHWMNAGFRYLTLHVKRVDASFEAMTADGAIVGERPYSIGKIARISFIRDPEGNWIEVAQRAALAGPWWDE
jgi:catechol 2,3-dioxygenase-like lactoylglutathione lyase family enzyme